MEGLNKYIYSDRFFLISDVLNSTTMRFVSVWCMMLPPIVNTDISKEILRLEDGMAAFLRSFDTKLPTAQRHNPEVRNLQDNLTTAIKEKDVYMSSNITK